MMLPPILPGAQIIHDVLIKIFIYCFRPSEFLKASQDGADNAGVLSIGLVAMSNIVNLVPRLQLVEQAPNGVDGITENL